MPNVSLPATNNITLSEARKLGTARVRTRETPKVGSASEKSRTTARQHLPQRLREARTPATNNLPD